MIQIEEKNGKKTVTVERGRGTEIFLINATVSDALIRHIFRVQECETEKSREDGTGGKESFTAEDISALRGPAREAGIPKWHTKKPENLGKEIEEKVNGDHT